MTDDAFQQRLNAAVIEAFDALSHEIEAETPYAIALFTCDSAMSIGFALSTEEHLAAGQIDADDLAYYRWATAEWRNEGWRDDLFQTFIRDPLAEIEDFAAYFDAVIDAMVAALAYLRSERGEQLVGVTLFVTVTDSDISEGIEDRTAQALNPPDLAARFLLRHSDAPGTC